MTKRGPALVIIAVLASCGGRSSRRALSDDDGATAGESSVGATGGGGNGAGVGGTGDTGGTGANTGGNGGAGGVAGASGRSCRDCPAEQLCTPEHACVPYECRLETESCGTPLCEGGGDCSVSWGPLTELPTVETQGLCYADGRLFVVEAGLGNVRSFSWPDLSPLARTAIPGSVFGDCATIGAALYFPGQNGIGRLDLASGDITVPAFRIRGTWARAVAADEGTLWASLDGGPELVRYSLDGTPLGQVPNTMTANECDGLEATPTGLWCIDLASRVLFKLSKQDGSVLAGPFFSQPSYALALIDGRLWAADDGFVYDPEGGLTGPDQPVEGIHPLILAGVEP